MKKIIKNYNQTFLMSKYRRTEEVLIVAGKDLEDNTSHLSPAFIFSLVLILILFP